MKVSIAREALLSDLNLCTSVIAKNDAHPILECVLVSVDADGVALSGTDLRATVTTRSQPVEVIAANRVAIPSKAFLDAVRALSGDVVHLSHQKGRLDITSDDAKFSVNALDGQDYPTLPDLDDGESITIPSDILHRALSETVYATDPLETRYQLGGVFVSCDKRRAEFGATTGYQLAITTIELPSPSSAKIFLPTRLIRAWLKHGDIAEDSTITWNRNHIAIRQSTRTFMHVALDMNFPKLRDAIPTNHDKTLLLDRDRFVGLLTRVMTFSDITKYTVFYISRGKLKATVTNQQVGEASDSIAVDYSGPDATFGLSAKRLIEAAKAITTDKIRLTFLDERSPVILLPEGDEPPDSLHMVYTRVP